MMYSAVRVDRLKLTVQLLACFGFVPLADVMAFMNHIAY
jgi:hypothetical protein